MFEGVRRRQTNNFFFGGGEQKKKVCAHLTRVVLINLQRPFCSVIMQENFMYV